MSGIAAIFYKHGRTVERDQLQRLAQALAPLGRKSQSIQTAGNVGFAFAQFPETPHCVFDNQPVSGGAGRFLMVFDGWFANRDDLTADLEPRATFKVADSTLAMWSWERWGPDAVGHWSGEFAVIVWDRHDGLITAVRDHLGRRTLSYHDDADHLVIASTPNAIFATGEVERAIDEQKIADALIQLFNDGQRSFFKNIKRLPGASRLEVTARHTQVYRYWSLDDAPTIDLPNDNAYLEAARDRLNIAVKRTLRSAGPVGAFMSGGLDSSTVAVTALDHLIEQDRLPVFTWVPEDEWDRRSRAREYGDERPFVEAIAAMHSRLEPHYVPAAGLGMFHLLDEMLDSTGVAPRNALNFCWLHEIQIEAKARGVGTLLDASMGNMSLSWTGDGTYLDLLHKRRWDALAHELPHPAREPVGFLKVLVHNLLVPAGPWPLPQAYWVLRWLRNPARGKPIWSTQSAINPEFARDLQVDERLRQFEFDYFQRPENDFRRMRTEILTNDTENEAGDLRQGFRALHGISIRDPLADKDLVEFCIGLPEEQFRRHREGRWLVKRLMKDRLPDSVLFNRKIGLQVCDWHLRMTRDMPKIRQELAAISDDPDTRRYVDIDRIRRFLDDWPDEAPLKSTRPSEYGYGFAMITVCQTLATARLVRRVKGANR